MIDHSAAVDLLAAVLRLWADDARRDPDELSGLAAWLEVEPATLRERMGTPPRRPRPRGNRER